MKKTAMKKLALILVVSLFFSTSVGCWSRVEVENLAIVTMIGIDKAHIKGKEQYRVTLRIVRTGQLGIGQQGGGGISRSASWTVVGHGATPQEAINNISTRSSREIFLAHSKFIVFGEKMASEGVQEVLDLLLRHRDIRLRNWILVTKGEAKTFLEIQSEIEQLISEELIGLVEQTRPLANKALALDLKNFAAQMATQGRDIAVSKIEFNTPPEPSNQVELEKAFGAKPESPVGKVPFLTGSAIFREDKLMGYLGDWETGGLDQVIGEAREGVYPVRVDDGGFLSFVMTRSEKEIKSKVEAGKFSFDVKVFVEGDIGEHSNPHEISVEHIPDHEKKVGEAIKNQIEAAIKAAQKDFKADILGFGEVVRRQHNPEWKKVKEDWREIFPEAKVNVTVEAKIRRQGMITDTLKVK